MKLILTALLGATIAFALSTSSVVAGDSTKDTAKRLALLTVKKPPAATLVRVVKSCEVSCADGKVETATCTATQACCADAGSCKVWCGDGGC